MGQWYSYVRSQDEATASVSVDIGINAERDIPLRSLVFLVVRRIEDGADPAPIKDLEDRLNDEFAAAGLLLVAVLTMSGSRTLVVYGDDEATLRKIVGATDAPFAIQVSEDPTWQLYRTLLPTNEEITL